MNKRPEKRDKPKTRAEKGQADGRMSAKNVPSVVKTFEKDKQNMFIRSASDNRLLDHDDYITHKHDTKEKVNRQQQQRDFNF